jgi:hypothetical protein
MQKLKILVAEDDRRRLSQPATLARLVFSIDSVQLAAACNRSKAASAGSCANKAQRVP